jgi:hypothetical protein
LEQPHLFGNIPCHRRPVREEGGAKQLNRLMGADPSGSTRWKEICHPVVLRESGKPHRHRHSLGHPVLLGELSINNLSRAAYS